VLGAAAGAGDGWLEVAIVNGVLVTTASMIADQRYSRPELSRAIARTAGKSKASSPRPSA
jgi:hypothetical protein